MRLEYALKELVEGNARFITGHRAEVDYTEQRAETADGQEPFAIVLGCSDSRVSPEIVFDQGIGKLFVIRTAGQTVDSMVLGSIEYGVEHLHVGLIVVLGHESCGAVSAAVGGSQEDGDIATVVEAIQPSVEASKGLSGDPVDNVVCANALRVAKELPEESEIINEHMKDGHLKIIAARYDLHSGRVKLLN